MATNKSRMVRTAHVAARQAAAARGTVDLGGSDGYDPVANTQGQAKLSLLEKLLLRSQGKAQPVAKRGRGRPRKVAVQAFMDGSGEPEDLL